MAVVRASIWSCRPTGRSPGRCASRSPVERGPNGQRKAKKLTLGIVADGHDRSSGDLQIGQPLSLADARTLATIALRKVESGVDPTLELRLAKTERQHAASRSDMIDDAMMEFLRRYRGKKRQGLRESTRRQIAIYFGLKPDPDQPGEWIKSGAGVLKRWSGRSLQSIAKRDVISLVDTMVDGGSPVSANRTLTVLKTLFAWLTERDVIAASPPQPCPLRQKKSHASASSTMANSPRSGVSPS